MSGKLEDPSDKEGWPAVLLALVRTFVLLRDIVGYGVPGALLVFLVVHVRGPQILAPLHAGMPWWVVVPTVATLAYVAGHFAVSVGYELEERLSGWHKSEAQASDVEAAPYRALYPELFVEADRRAIIATMRLGLAGSLLLAEIPYLLGGLGASNVQRALALCVAGLFMLRAGHAGRKHASALRATSVEAAKTKQASSPGESK